MSKKTDNSSAPVSLPQLCLISSKRFNKQDALNHKREDQWIPTSSAEFVARIKHIALGLAELGVKQGDRIALLSENRPEWPIADMAILSLGAVNVPIYTTQAVDQVSYILQDSGARFIFVSNRRVFRHAREAIDSTEGLERVIFFDSDAVSSTTRGMKLEDVEQAGRERAQIDLDAYEKFVSRVRPDDLATIIYTSGTTGEPKGVMLTHHNFLSNVVSVADTLPITATDVALSVLPLSHIFERTVFYVFCWTGVSVYYSASFDQIGEHLREVRPTVMTAVPRLFEKVYHRIVKKGMAEQRLKRKIFSWALETGRRYAETREKKRVVSPILAAQQAVASRLVFSKWREGVGGRLRYFVSGGAPLSPALSYAFLAAGIPILQGFGMTETCIVSANRPNDNCVGSVGLPFPGIDVKIAEDGEILVRGPNVMKGYYNHPVETANSIREGWFATGDVGRIDKTGHLYITDRKKDLFKLSNGKYVAPQLIESLIKQSEFVNQVVVIGAGRKHPAALIVPDWDALKAAAPAEAFNGSTAEMSRNVRLVKLVQREVTALTAELNDYERVRRVALLPSEMSIDSGELTPTLKVKRRVIDEKYHALIEELYGEGGGGRGEQGD